jgi:hypothetical protein
MEQESSSAPWLRRIAAIAGLLLASGCGGPAYKYDAVVTGTVTIDGELAKSGTITFHPVSKGQAALGRINPDGSYSLRTGQGDLSNADGGTVSSGEYVVTASITTPAASGEAIREGGPPKPGPSLIDKKYATKDTTDLRYTVKPGEQVIVLELKGADTEAATVSAAPEVPTPAATGEKAEGKTEQTEKTEAPKEKSESPPTPEASNPATENPTAGPEK